MKQGTIERRHLAPGFSDDPTLSTTPDAEFFYSPAVYEREKQRIFYRNWLFFCHASEVPAPGDYRVGSILDQSIFVLRGSDGEVRAFFNVCQHRAHQLLQGSGRVGGAVRCPYHSWTYGLDGALRHAPRCEAVRDFDKSGVAMQPVRLENVGGFLFVNLDLSAPPLEEAAPGFRKRLLDIVPRAQELKHARTRGFEIKANWKVVVENFLENYHSFYSGPAHKQLSDVIDQSSYHWDIDGKVIEFAGRGGSPEQLPYRSAGPRQFGGRTEGFIIVYLWPSVAFIVVPGANVLLAFQMNPTGPETTSEPLAYYTLDGQVDAASDSAVDWFNEALGPEDVELVESVQRGLHSLGYRAGRLMVDPDCASAWSEHFLHHFNVLNLDALGLAGRAASTEDT